MRQKNQIISFLTCTLIGGSTVFSWANLSPIENIVLYQEVDSGISELAYQPSTSDDIAGIDATTLTGGFHSAVENPNDMTPAFTDGVGSNELAGLLEDPPWDNREGVAAWSGFWLLDGGQLTDIYELHIFAAQPQEHNGQRCGQHYDVYVTNDPNPDTNSTWELLIEEVTSQEFGTPFVFGEMVASCTALQSTTGALATEVTALRLDFHAISDMESVFVDDWDPGSPDDRDELESAFISPLIVEVDVFFDPQPCISSFDQMTSSINELNLQPDTDDDLANVVATTLSGGFHAAVEDPDDMTPAFTDGVGANQLAGLLRDLNFPDREGLAAWSGFWLLDEGQLADLNEFRVFAANPDDINGTRCAQHYDAYVTTDLNPGPDSQWVLLMEEVTTMDFGTPHDPETRASCSSLRSCNGVLASQVTALRLDFFTTDSFEQSFVDDWNPGSPQDQDGLESAFISPLIVEVDAYINQTSTPIFYDFPETGMGDGWTFTRPEMYSDIEGEYNPDSEAWDVTLTNNQMSFGFLESPLITVDSNMTPPTLPNTMHGSTGPDQLYRTTFSISSDLEDISLAPVVRLRISSESFQRSDLVVVSSEQEGNLSPGMEERLYTAYFQLPENENKFHLDVDILNFDPRDTTQGTVSLQYAEIEFLGNIDQLGTATPVISENFLSDEASGWNPYSVESGLITAPDTFSSNIGEGLLIRGVEAVSGKQEPGNPIAIFGYWAKKCTCFPLQESLYRIQWSVGTNTDDTTSEKLPTFRLRFNDETMKFASMVNIDSVAQNTNLPSVSNPVIYDSWFMAPPEVIGNNWELSFDYLYIDKLLPNTDNPNASLILQSVEVMRYDLP